MPEFKFPNIDPREINLRDIDLEQAAANLNGAVKDAAYAAVGFGMLGLQRAQVHRVEMTKQLGERFSELSVQLGDLARAVEDALVPVRHEIDERLDGIEEALPSPADGVLHSLRESASAGERAVRSALKPKGAGTADTAETPETPDAPDA